MHLSPWVFTSFLTAATAATLKVNYYSDGGCSDYMTSLYPGSGWSCVDYVWSGSNSMNIADCTFPNGKCVCTFYTQPHCKGASQDVVYPNDNCASNWGRGFYSMKCGVVHDS
ncbi:uncharacterized protein CDV56_103404 [Aspergillus thermomutatus]|uniref:Extracellular membrane protein CFEM domain-containing protein n=1 Tax=Aspergillus thermomutatus TaxID=41047 RepID=A0A397G9E0_ASPTH|nr:uncharacterized protein CDV56_103404 [Aspergillus thermomutatus]RHZ46514.1 hypothetical protein CDV56_103404 [Aspergillus thermomutatus]